MEIGDSQDGKIKVGRSRWDLSHLSGSDEEERELTELGMEEWVEMLEKLDRDS